MVTEVVAIGSGGGVAVVGVVGSYWCRWKHGNDDSGVRETARTSSPIEECIVVLTRRDGRLQGPPSDSRRRCLSRHFPRTFLPSFLGSLVPSPSYPEEVEDRPSVLSCSMADLRKS